MWPMPVALRRVLLLAPPLALAALEIIHPQPDENPQALMDVATWFAGFHVIQLVLTGFVAMSVLLLADSLAYAKAWAIRLGLGVFLVFFSAYDAVAGIGTGLAMRSARDLSAVQQEGVFDVVKDWPALGAPFVLSIVGTLGGWPRSVLWLLQLAAKEPRDANGSSSGWAPWSSSVGTRSRPEQPHSAASSWARFCMSSVHCLALQLGFNRQSL
jgi:hypothetical protein